jgi:parallel beta-helix repeat protein
MRSEPLKYRIVSLAAFVILGMTVAACGGNGDDGGGGGGNNTANPTSPGAVRTATPTPSRQATAPGGTTPTPSRSGTTSPTVQPTPTPIEITVPSGSDINAFARNAPAGATLLVSPGSYRAVDLQPGMLKGALTIIGDTTGELTEGPPTGVVISAGSRDAAFSIAEQSEVTIDGLTLIGGRKAALMVTQSDGIGVFNCTMRGSPGSGVLFELSVSALVFNNLIYNNTGTGVLVLGSDDIFFINNTVYGHRNHGFLASSAFDFPSTGLFLQNNIFHNNVPRGITIDTTPPSSLDGYFADYNLNSDGYGADTPPGINDINTPGSPSNPQFIDPRSGDFRLSQSSPAVNAGDFDTDPDLVDILVELTTQLDATLDTPPVDLGYHYPPPTPTPEL